MLVIIDYGAGNLRSVVNAFLACGEHPKITNSTQDVLDAGAVVLPGVGAAGSTVKSLKGLKLDEAISRVIAEERPFFGVCVGLQVLFSTTEEGGWQECLKIIPGTVKRLSTEFKVPHIGWNQVKQRQSHPIFEGIPDQSNFYFVHSYYPIPEDSSIVAGETDYGVKFCSMIARGNLVATQFHPEKSGEVGLRMYANFLKMVSRS